MKKIKQYNILGIAGLHLLAISFFLPSQTVDMHIHDTYFVMNMPYTFRNMSCMLLALFTLSTLLTEKLRNSILSWFHVTLTVLTTVTAIFFLYRALVAYHPSFSDWTSIETNNNLLVIIILTFSLAQILF